MTRKMLTATMLVAALLLSVLSFGALTDSAVAQDQFDESATNCNWPPEFMNRCGYGGAPTCPYNAAIIDGFCADALAYPGPFTNMPTTPGGPYGWGKLNPVAGDGPAVTPGGGDGGTGGGLAHTGSEAAVLAYAGAGLIAFGAVALGSRRKFFQGALED